MRKIANIKTKLLVIPLLLIFYLIMYALNTTCIFKSTFGFACMGCGMTRALISAIKFDLVGAFKFHPMFWSVPILLLYFLYDGCLFYNKKINTFILSAIALGFLLNWIVRIVV